jgi:hypothetical protein
LAHFSSVAIALENLARRAPFDWLSMKTAPCSSQSGLL